LSRGRSSGEALDSARAHEAEEHGGKHAPPQCCIRP
jgi:hypothetical protein